MLDDIINRIQQQMLDDIINRIQSKMCVRKITWTKINK